MDRERAETYLRLLAGQRGQRAQPGQIIPSPYPSCGYRYQAVPAAGTTGGTMASIRCGPGSA